MNQEFGESPLEGVLPIYFRHLSLEAWQREVVREIAESVGIPRQVFSIRPARGGGLELLAARIALEVTLAPDIAEELGLMTETVKAEPAPEEKESLEDIKRRARKPPSKGPCRGCGKNKPLNRLMLCYKCWVDKQNTGRGWREGQPHPAGCGCDLECRFESKGDNN